MEAHLLSLFSFLLSLFFLLMQTLRAQLRLSHILNAALTVLVLGLILIVTLRQYYTGLEEAYLERNGETMRTILEGSTDSFEDVDRLELQLQALSFLTQTRIRIFSAEREIVADSGGPTFQSAQLTLTLQVEKENLVQAFEQTLDTDAGTGSFVTQLSVEDGRQTVQTTTSVRGGSEIFEVDPLVSPFELIGQPFSPSQFDAASTRSDLVLEMPILTYIDGTFYYLELSEGPAFGDPIVTTVGWVTAIAGLISIVVAALLGSWQSGTLSRSILRLKAVSQQMAAGDLSVRAAHAGPAEIQSVSAAFNRMADQLEELVSELRRFVADAAHEISTPLTALRTQLELAQNGEGGGHNLDSALLQTDRMANLTADLLQLSKLEQDDRSRVEQINWNELIARQSETAAARAEQRGVAFHLELPKDPVFISGVRESIEALVDNLFDNALKFTLSEGEIRVQLDRDDAGVELSIADTGIGFEEAPDRLFERFYRGKNASKAQGNGLGLAIVKRIVEQHGGQISASSRPGGSRFSVHLPL
ncbi:MAG: HAMP domain-containing sensor histidine kinase, partial [Chloroflexota bacterium]